MPHADAGSLLALLESLPGAPDGPGDRASLAVAELRRIASRLVEERPAAWTRRSLAEIEHAAARADAAIRGGRDAPEREVQIAAARLLRRVLVQYARESRRTTPGVLPEGRRGDDAGGPVGLASPILPNDPREPGRDRATVARTTPPDARPNVLPDAPADAGPGARAALERLVGELDDDIARGDGDLVALDAAIDRLAGFDPEGAAVIDLGYFGGLSADAIASILGLAPGTIRRRARLGRAWLRQELRRAAPRGRR